MTRPLAATALTAVIVAGVGPAAWANEQNVVDACEVIAWEASWGVKESFRAYLSGSIANGEWTTEGDIGYETPLFSFTGDTGQLARDGASGEVSTEGAMRFVGHDGLLDQTLSSPHIVLDGTQALVLFDVQGDTQEGLSVDQGAVEFVSVDISQADVDQEAGLWTVSAAPTTLTVAGADAFGTYPAGEPFDPFNVSISVKPGCLEPVADNRLFLGLGGGALVTVLAAIVLARRWRARERRGQMES